MAEFLTAENLLYALLGGVLPPLLWLWFWLKEDRHPEPRKILIMTFLAGMGAVPLAFMAERLVLSLMKWSGAGVAGTGFIVLLLSWAFIEEILKYLAAKYAALKKKSFDEPVDAMIYLITAAIGFAAMENVLFLIKSFEAGAAVGMAAGNMRFIGANLLHIAASSIVGASLAFSFFPSRDASADGVARSKNRKRGNLIAGIFIATLLHFIFNYFIINNNGGSVLKVFIPLWLSIVVIIFLFEKVKKIKESRGSGRL